MGGRIHFFAERADSQRDNPRFLNDQFHRKAWDVLKFWVAYELENLSRIKAGIHQFTMPDGYRPNETTFRVGDPREKLCPRPSFTLGTHPRVRGLSLHSALLPGRSSGRDSLCIVAAPFV